jgi:redox-sensitive bicupin YhaK (pirin superfamily)
MGFGSFHTARRTIRGFEAMNMILKGQVQGVDKETSSRIIKDGRIKKLQ